MDAAALSPEVVTLLRRAVSVMRAASPAEVGPSTAAEYRRVVGRILARAGADGVPPPIERMTTSRGYYAQLRAAWSRHAHDQLVEAIKVLRRRELPVAEGMRRIRIWLGQLERYPLSKASDPASDRPGDRAPSRLTERLLAEGARPAAKRSKRGLLAGLGSSWLNDLWAAASERPSCRYLDALAVLLATGCRPAELEAGVLVEGEGKVLAFSIPGAKVRDSGEGQPWRRLRVAAAKSGPTAHLVGLTRGGPALVQGPAAAALSAAVADVAGDRWGRRISAYDIRHQRAADIRNAFNGDVEECARWMGHAADSTLRYYARLPGRAGCAGPLPISADAPRPIRRRLSDRRADPKPASTSSIERKTSM